MKKLLTIGLLACALSSAANAATLFEDDFEDGNLTGWNLNDPGHWDNSTSSPITGLRSLQHHDIDMASESLIYANTSFDLTTTKTTTWRCNLKNGNWGPSGDNRFWVYLTGTNDGYAVGVNLTGTDDRLKLWRIADGSNDGELIASTFNWAASTLAGIEVQRSPSGVWNLLVDDDGGFDNLVSAGTATDATYTASSEFGLHFDFTKTRAGLLWMDDVLISQVILSNEPPVLDPIGDKDVFENDSLIFTVTASDPVDGDPITITATNLPMGAVFVNDTFTWNNAVPVGAYSVTFIATDKDGSDSETITSRPADFRNRRPKRRRWRRFPVCGTL